jgi:type IV pilus assembly protein PilC
MNNPAESSLQKDKAKGKNHPFECHVRLRAFPDQSKDITIEARSFEDAVQKLLADGYVVVSVKQKGESHEDHSYAFLQAMSHQLPAKKGASPKFGFSLFQTISTRELIFFAIQLSTLLRAGVPLLRSLEIVQKGIVNEYFKSVLVRIRKKISEGGTFSQALRAQGRVFPWVWINLVEVGESTGKLPECLEEIEHYQESAARIANKVATAFFYPGILTCAVIAAMVFLLIFIVPKFSAIFEAQHMKLPVLTQVVVAISNVVRTKAWILLVFLAAVGGAVAYLRKLPKVRIGFDMMSLGAPIFGVILTQVAVVRFSRSLGTMLRSGVPILQALEISGRLVENEYLEFGIKQVATAIKGGQGLGSQLEARKIFPVFMTQLLSVGEESGQLEKFLSLLANYYEDRVDTFLARLTVLLEPFLLIFMGAVIGTVVVSMFLPIIELSTHGGG